MQFTIDNNKRHIQMGEAIKPVFELFKLTDTIAQSVSR